MRTLKYLTSLILLVTISFMLSMCSEDDPITPDPAFTVAGSVTAPDFNGTSQPAEGAVIYLASNATAATTNYDMTAIADGSGNYTFEGLSAGNYFMFANYNTDNQNNPSGRFRGINFYSGEGFLFTISDANMNQNIPMVNVPKQIDHMVDFTSGWSLDGSHSICEFEFAYDESNAPFQGSFSGLDMDILFDKDNLASSSISAKIDLLSVNTRSRGGRDPYFESSVEQWAHGCLAGTFGVAFTDALDGYDGVADETTRYADFTSTGISEYGDGFLAKGNMTFNGQTNAETIFFRFINGYASDTRQMSSFEGVLEFSPLADYGIESSHVLNGDITVNLNIQVRVDL